MTRLANLALWLALLPALLLVAPTAVLAASPGLLALCYHDVVESESAALADSTAVTLDALVKQFAWLQAAGYQPISLRDWAAAEHGGELPEKPVLLTFDDGYASFHQHVLPLLRLFDFPAVLAPVTSWVDAPADGAVRYGDELVDRNLFLNWEQIREAVASGLVELASHSHDLHHGIVGNPFGNTQPAAVTRGYDADTGRYEPEHAYLERVGADLRRSTALLQQHAGVSPEAIVWPYGAYNAQAAGVAGEAGLDYSFTLDDAPNALGQYRVHRKLIGSDMNLQHFVMTVRGLYPPQPLRAAHIDLDYVYDADPQQQARNLDQLLDRIKAMGINRVFLQAFADPDGDGVADALYFPNRHLPMRADLFNRVAWQLQTRAGVEVFAWMPVLAFELPDAAANRNLAVRAADGSHVEQYHRLSPFHPRARQIITEIYADLGRSSRFRGVLFHDDALLTEQEDVNPAAVDYFRRHPHLGDADGAALAQEKTRLLIAFTEDLADELRRYHPALVTARNLYARVVTDPDSERRFAQNLRAFVAAYDHPAVMAMPYLEGAAKPEPWLSALVRQVDAIPGALAKTVFEVQTVDWRTGTPLADATLARHLDALLDAGAQHIAWYPDDFIAGRPGLGVIRSRLSVASFPALLE
ncbi:MAG: poly-beta-1,6-N-acetyl-D-glucosamine N-deacetylase PgaB [Pseudomonadales bacterium]